MDIYSLNDKGESSAHIAARRKELEALKWCSVSFSDLRAYNSSKYISYWQHFFFFSLFRPRALSCSLSKLVGFDMFAEDDFGRAPLLHAPRGSSTKDYLQTLQDEQDSKKKSTVALD